MLLALIALVFALGAPGLTPSPAPTAPPKSLLPATQPGASREEGVFLVTTADDGSRAIYFIAQNTRHSIQASDLQVEQQLNPLWPLRTVSPDEVLAFSEATPIGSAKPGLLKAPAPEPVVDDAEPAAVSANVDAPSADALPSTYTLRPGDNLTRLSERYGTSVEAILATNGLTDANRIFFGQSLTIPSASTEAVTPSDSAADSIVEAPADPAPLADSPEPTADISEATSQTTYTVRPGDSAILIARKFDVDVDVLLAVNGVANRNRVYAGQTLTIPG